MPVPVRESERNFRIKWLKQRRGHLGEWRISSKKVNLVNDSEMKAMWVSKHFSALLPSFQFPHAAGSGLA